MQLYELLHKISFYLAIQSDQRCLPWSTTAQCRYLVIMCEMRTSNWTCGHSPSYERETDSTLQMGVSTELESLLCPYVLPMETVKDLDQV